MAPGSEGEWQEGPGTRGSARCATTYTTVNVVVNLGENLVLSGFGKMCLMFHIKVLMHCIEMNIIRSHSFFLKLFFTANYLRTMFFPGTRLCTCAAS